MVTDEPYRSQDNAADEHRKGMRVIRRRRLRLIAEESATRRRLSIHVSTGGDQKEQDSQHNQHSVHRH